MESATLKHKHKENYEIEVDFPSDFFEMAKEEALYVLKNKEDEYFKKIFDFIAKVLPSDYSKESFIIGYTFAKAMTFRKTNGVNLIPFPVSFSTVDVATVCEHEGKVLLLLGRKPGQEKFQFPGGFRDPKETNAMASKRELNEETNLKLDLKRFKYIEQLFIDDIRYRNSCHKVTTTLYLVYATYDEIISAVAGDDLEEVRIFDISELENNSDSVRDIHLQLLSMLIEFLKNKG